MTKDGVTGATAQRRNGAVVQRCGGAAVKASPIHRAAIFAPSLIANYHGLAMVAACAGQSAVFDQ
jgi:hypothetical protein